MRDIYLIDFENVASEGLSGITYLCEEDQVIIFYSNNSNRLTMKMHILIGKSVCNLEYFEVTVGGKNALDHQISTWLGYLIGTGAAERNYYIVSRDMGYKHVANFWSAKDGFPKVRCVDTIKAAGRLERNRKENRESVNQEIRDQLTEEAEAAVAELPAEASQILPELQVQTEPAVSDEANTVEALVNMETPESGQAAAESVAEGEEDPVQTVQDPVKSKYRSRGNVRRTRNKSYNGKNQEKDQEAGAVEQKQAEDEAKAAPTPRQDQKKAGDKRSGGPQKEENSSGSVDWLGAMIAPYPKLQESVLRDLIANNKRQILCNTLRKHLGQEKGLALYNEIKKTAWH